MVPGRDALAGSAVSSPSSYPTASLYLETATQSSSCSLLARACEASQLL